MKQLALSNISKRKQAPLLTTDKSSKLEAVRPDDTDMVAAMARSGHGHHWAPDHVKSRVSWYDNRSLHG